MFRRRVNILICVFVAPVVAVAVQLARLQILHGDTYRELAREGRTWDELEPAPRGRILDARGETLARDQPSYGLAVVAAELPLERVRVADVREMRDAPAPDERRRRRAVFLDRLASGEAAVQALAEATGLDTATLADGLVTALENAVRYGSERYPEPFVFGLDRDAWLRLEVLLNPVALPRQANRRKGDAAREVLMRGVECVTRAGRAYPCGSVACHVVGHVGEYDQGEVDSLRTWGRAVAGPRARLDGFREAIRGPEAALEMARLLGRDPGGIESAAELSAVLREALRSRPGAVGLLTTALGPEWVEMAEWLGRPDEVELTEGERIWIAPRGHLKDRRIGRTGVERAANWRLRGRHGYRVVIRGLAIEDGRPVPELDYIRSMKPQPGEDVRLTIDLRFQREVETALAGTGLPAAAVFVDPRDGAVRAVASAPAFDPNVFAAADPAEIAAVLNDPRKPLMNRAIQGAYAPGSVFKVVVAIAAIEENAISPETSFECRHEYEIGGHVLRCLADPGHGWLGVTEALTKSCNIFFYQTAERLGAEALVGKARAFGFGERSGLDLPGESAGSLPEADVARGVPRTTLAQLGIGQGPITVTPLQIAQLFAAIANDGPVYRPHVMEGPPVAERVVRFSPEARAAVLEGIRGVIDEPGGTAYSAFHKPAGPGGLAFSAEFPFVRVTGKTGTAERGRRRPPHAWFAGFAPADAPEIVFAVVVEGGGHGGNVAAPVVARALAAYFRLNPPRGGAAGAGKE